MVTWVLGAFQAVGGHLWGQPWNRFSVKSRKSLLPHRESWSWGSCHIRP